MNFALNGTTRIAWRCDGPSHLPALVLCNSIGTNHTIWDNIVEPLSRHFHVVRIDTRGHGQSDAPLGDYTLAQLAGDINAVAEAAKLQKFDLCGVSLGAMMAMTYALEHPQKLRRLVLCNTSTTMDPKAWQQRIDTVRESGMQSIVDMAMARFFTPNHIKQNSPEFQKVREQFLAMSPIGYSGCCAAIRDMALTARLAEIRIPTLVITGAQDVSTPHEVGEAIANKIPGALIQQLSAAHIPASEVPDEFCTALQTFLID